MSSTLIKHFSSQSLSRSFEESINNYLEKLNKNDPEYLYRDVIKQVEYPLLKVAIMHCLYNQSKAARCLGINRSTLNKKLKDYGLL